MNMNVINVYRAPANTLTN